MKILAVDGNWVLFRAASVQPESTLDPSTDIAKRFVGMICRDAAAVKATHLFVAFDGPRNFRYEIDKEYKANRGEKSNVYDYLGGLLEYLAMLGIPSVQLSKYEADDILCSVANKYPNVVIATKDKDAYQYLKDGVILYDSSNKVNGKPSPKITKHTDVEAIYGVPAKLMVDLQTLIGDKIDNVPSIVPKSKAIKGLLKYGSITEWASKDKEFKSVCRYYKDRLVKNQKLVKLVSNVKIEVPGINWNLDSKLPTSYIQYRDQQNPKSKGLF